MLLINNMDLSEIATDIKFVSPWNNGAGSLTFEYPSAKAPMYPNGSTVIFTYQEANIFYGWLFRTGQDKKNYQCVCYDQLRYFKSSNTIMRDVETLDSFLNKVAYAINNRIRLGNVDSTEVMLGKYLFDNKSHLDMIYQSIEDNFLLNNYLYTLRDNFGALDLRDTLDLRIPLVIGDKSLATDFDYEKSIDEDTYNYIKVAKDNKEMGVRDIYVAMDSSTMGDETTGWGKLIFYEKVTADLNDAQIAERANRLLAIKNRETETLKVESIGDVRVFGGTGIKIEIAQAGLDLWAIVDSVTHRFTRTKHTMTMNLLFGR